MNIAMEQAEEYVNGQLKAKYGDCFIRGNNGESPHGSCMCVQKPRALRASVLRWLLNYVCLMYHQLKYPSLLGSSALKPEGIRSLACLRMLATAAAKAMHLYTARATDW